MMTEAYWVSSGIFIGFLFGFIMGFYICYSHWVIGGTESSAALVKKWWSKLWKEPLPKALERPSSKFFNAETKVEKVQLEIGHITYYALRFTNAGVASYLDLECRGFVWGRTNSYFPDCLTEDQKVIDRARDLFQAQDSIVETVV